MTQDFASFATAASVLVMFMGVMLSMSTKLVRHIASNNVNTYTKLRSSQVRTVIVAVGCAAGGLVVSIPYGVLFRGIDRMLSRTSPTELVTFWERHPWLAFFAAFIFWDAAGFAYHWLGHRTRIGWASHQAHHTGDSYDITLGLRQTWLPLLALPCFGSVLLLGFNVYLLVVVAAVSNTWQFVIHSRVDLPLGPIEQLVMTPSTHFLHHRDESVNLGPVFTVWDRIASTWQPSQAKQIGVDRLEGPLPARPASLIRIQFGEWSKFLQHPGASRAVNAGIGGDPSDRERPSGPGRGSHQAGLTLMGSHRRASRKAGHPFRLGDDSRGYPRQAHDR
jgi:sterol desaturase/sphingolipid hydroxylase (fatty acid hydroxylase superfamily)